jgi:hypothetical protein
MIDCELEIAIECPARNLGIEPVHQRIDLAKRDDALDLLPPHETERGCCDDTKETIAAHYMTE